ncbi:MAG: signal peptidase I [Victivallaceae bacterium]|nr:signal peptidase I [Victivallaceae bacterium]
MKMLFGKAAFKGDRKTRKFLSKLVGMRIQQDDLLPEISKLELDRIIDEISADGRAVDIERTSRQEYALPGIRRYSAMREFIDLVCVVFAVAFGIRGLFFQPFKIPTSSMQPTLYGIHYRDNLTCPQPFNMLLFGGRRAELTARRGTFEDCDASPGFFDDTFVKQGGSWTRLPGDRSKVIDYANMTANTYYFGGEIIANGSVVSGDHLFVERFSLYFLPPRRGDIMVFTTEGITDIRGVSLRDSSGFYYVKRIVGLPGDTLRLRNNQLYVRPRDASSFSRIQDIEPKFAKIYSGKGGYHGHVSDMGESCLLDEATDYTVPDNCYFMLGDNSRFSRDSRFFGAVPRKNLVGRAAFVFWPLSRRWGLPDIADPIDVPTGRRGVYTFPVMWRQ